MDHQNSQSWSSLLDSIIPHLKQKFIHLAITQGIWEATSKTLYDGSIETRLFELNKQSFTTKQNIRPLSTYSNELIAIFRKLTIGQLHKGDQWKGLYNYILWLLGFEFKYF